MNTKEAIESLKSIRENFDAVPTWNKSSHIYDEITEIIELLQQNKENEKYKKMWDELDKRLIPGYPIPYHNDLNIKDLSTLDFVKLIIKDIKQKYFPEEVKKNIWEDKFYELKEEFEEIERELKREIEYWKFEYFNKRR